MTVARRLARLASGHAADLRGAGATKPCPSLSLAGHSIIVIPIETDHRTLVIIRHTNRHHRRLAS